MKAFWSVPIVLPMVIGFAVFLTGCGGTPKPVSNPTLPAIGGNYQLTPTSTTPSAGGLVAVSGGLTLLGGVAVNGHDGAALVCPNPSGQGTQSIGFFLDFSGSVGFDDKFELSSTAPLFFSAQGMVSPDGSTISGTYTDARVCAAGTENGTFSAVRIPTVNGTYAGDIALDSAKSIHVTLQIQQTATADPLTGQFFFTVAASFTGSPCFTSGTVVRGPVEVGSPANIMGTSTTMTLTTNEAGSHGFSFVIMDGIFDNDVKTITVSYRMNGESACVNDRGSGVLTLQ